MEAPKLMLRSTLVIGENKLNECLTDGSIPEDTYLVGQNRGKLVPRSLGESA
jgi:hypothetical protein